MTTKPDVYTSDLLETKVNEKLEYERCRNGSTSGEKDINKVYL